MSQMILLNGDLRTQDPDRPRAQAIALEGNRIQAVGSDDEIRRLIGPGSEQIDLAGRLVLPGLTDGHVHFLQWALMRTWLPLSKARSLDDLLGQVVSAARTKGSNEWIMGTGFDESGWPEARVPTRNDLDRAAPNQYVILRRKDCHSISVNSRVLELAGIGERTPDPSGGIIERHSDGRPNGVLKDRAMDLAEKIIPPPTEKEALSVMAPAIQEINALGLTGLHDMRIGGRGEGRLSSRAWNRLQQEGLLSLRCWAAIPGEMLDEVEALGLCTGFGGPRLQTGHLKIFLDGSLGSKTAWVLEPYRDGTYGIPILPLNQVAGTVEKAEGAGFAVSIHSIGDRANRELIQSLEGIQKQGKSRGGVIVGRRKIPHRVEHLQIIRPGDIARFAHLGIVACMQPLHATDEIELWNRYLGPDFSHGYCFRSLIDQGAQVVFGSDCPVSDPNPFWAIHAAVTRRRRDGTPPGGWFPEQCITVTEAVRAYTLAAALACGRESELGSLVPGKLADLVVLDRNIFEIDPMEIHRTSVDMTIFDGSIAFER
jgi:predicted amidohydrolase YtcJ